VSFLGRLEQESSNRFAEGLHASTMPVTFAGQQIFALGAVVGVFVHSFSNSVRKVAFTHRPWEIPVAALVGGMAFSWWDGICERTQSKMVAERAERLQLNAGVVPEPTPAPVPKY